MKSTFKPELLKVFAPAAGLLGLVLRTILYSTGMDSKGLLISGHWAGTALWILTAAVIGALFLLTRPIQDPQENRYHRAASFPAALGALAAAAGMITGILSGNAPLLWIPAAAAFLLIAFFRMMGKRVHFLCHAVLCVCFAMEMVSQYRGWNSDPQLTDYAFYLGAYVALMLTAYQQAAFDSEMGRQRNLWCVSLIAVYLSIVTLNGGADTLQLLGAALWALTNVTNPKPVARRKRPRLDLEEE